MRTDDQQPGWSGEKFNRVEFSILTLGWVRLKISAAWNQAAPLADAVS